MLRTHYSCFQPKFHEGTPTRVAHFLGPKSKRTEPPAPCPSHGLRGDDKLRIRLFEALAYLSQAGKLNGMPACTIRAAPAVKNAGGRCPATREVCPPAAPVAFPLAPPTISCRPPWGAGIAGNMPSSAFLPGWISGYRPAGELCVQLLMIRRWQARHTAREGA